ncbi:MAG: hypothetical protein ACOC8E_03445 [Planctomycetota bacterium]
MRILVPAALLALVLARAACGGEATRPSYTAAAGVVRRDGTIVLQKTGEAYRPTGLSTALYTFAGRRAVPSIRLEHLALPDGCDVFTQYRWRDPHGEWQAWRPTNLLRNGDFRDGVPKGARRHEAKGKRGPGEPARWASKRIRKADQSAWFWRAPVPPGTDLTFAASVSTAEKEADGYLSLAARLRNEADEPLATVEAVSAGDTRTGAWRRLSVGMVTPPAARRLDGGVRLMAKKPSGRGAGGTGLRAAEGALVFHREPARPAVLFRGDVSGPAKWEVHKGPVSWPKDRHGGLRLSPDVRRDVVPTARVAPREKTALGTADWIEIRAAVTLEDAEAHVSAAVTGEGGHTPGVVRLACRAVDGTYHFRASRAVPEGATHAKLIVYAFVAEEKKKGTVTVHDIELRAVDEPPAFSPRPPADRITLPKAVRTKELEVRSYLMTSDAKATPSFGGYRIGVGN